MWLAEDGGGTAVALKALHPALTSSDAARARLRRETRTVNAVQSPFVAHIVDAETDASQPFVVSEYVAGPTLAEVVKSGPVPMRGVAALSFHLASTIAAVHRADVIHRDIKPSNIICSQRGPVLIDFGIAMGAEDEHLTSTGLVSGTAGYTAPELLAGRPPSRDSDWWAWCATLLSCATGRPPFGRGGMKATILRVMQGEPDLAGLSPRIVAALSAGLGTEPEGRPSPSLVVADLMDAVGWAPGELDYASVNWAELLNTGERTVSLSSDPQEIAAPPQWDEAPARPSAGAALPVVDGPPGVDGAAQGASGSDEADTDGEDPWEWDGASHTWRLHEDGAGEGADYGGRDGHDDGATEVYPPLGSDGDYDDGATEVYPLSGSGGGGGRDSYDGETTRVFPPGGYADGATEVYPLSGSGGDGGRDGYDGETTRVLPPGGYDADATRVYPPGAHADPSAFPGPPQPYAPPSGAGPGYAPVPAPIPYQTGPWAPVAGQGPQQAAGWAGAVPGGAQPVPPWGAAPGDPGSPKTPWLTGAAVMAALAVAPLAMGLGGTLLVGAVLTAVSLGGALAGWVGRRRSKHGGPRSSDGPVALLMTPLLTVRCLVQLAAGVLLGGAVPYLLWGFVSYSIGGRALWEWPARMMTEVDPVVSADPWLTDPDRAAIVWALAACALVLCWLTPFTRDLKKGFALGCNRWLRPPWARLGVVLVCAAIMIGTWALATGGWAHAA